MASRTPSTVAPARPRASLPALSFNLWAALATSLVAGGGCVLMLSLGRLPSPTSSSIVLTVAPLCALVALPMLSSRSAAEDDRGLEWVAIGLAVACLALLLQLISFPTVVVGGGPLGTRHQSSAVLYLAFHLWLYGCTVFGALRLPRFLLRPVLVVGTLVAVLAALNLVPAPALLTADQAYTPALVIADYATAALGLVAVLLWSRSSGPFPTPLRGWIGVMLLLSTYELALNGMAERRYDGMWWSSLLMRAAGFGVLAAGGLAYLLRQSRRVEQFSAAELALRDTELRDSLAINDRLLVHARELARSYSPEQVGATLCSTIQALTKADRVCVAQRLPGQPGLVLLFTRDLDPADPPTPAAGPPVASTPGAAGPPVPPQAPPGAGPAASATARAAAARVAGPTAPALPPASARPAASAVPAVPATVRASTAGPIPAGTPAPVTAAAAQDPGTPAQARAAEAIPVVTRPTYWTSRAEIERHLPPGERPPDDIAAMAVLPLGVGDLIIGMLVVEERVPRGWSAAERELLEGLADQAGPVLSRARLAARERQAAETLQRGLLPRRLPVVPGLCLTARYQPASREEQVGGDWYDGWSLPDGRLALVIGDVVGKGLSAAAATGRLRASVRALAASDPSPGRVLTHLDRIEAEDSTEMVATVLYALFDADLRTVRIARAGHLPPIVVPPSGSAELVTAGGGTPIGLAAQPIEETVVSLRPGSTMVMYTDGLVEDRARPIQKRLDELVRTIRHELRGGTPEALATHLMTRFRTNHEDDVALLVAAHQDPATR